ncbi:hypothetical protein BSPWISOXPB_11402 [uncultured Gammaproteobacteria bacterium]|nr:hypothetical protein BSPWISOXPB_11402 [uncultured Gammaproteobacteria bacterium]
MITTLQKCLLISKELTADQNKLEQARDILMEKSNINVVVEACLT